MKSRDKFVRQLANNIRRNHASEKEASFIFGISGKWGEGKTTFLKDLESELSQNGEFRVVWVSPWKYGDDKIALLRNFLLTIKPEVKVKKFVNIKWKELFLIYGKTENDVIKEKYNFLNDLKILFRKVRRRINDKDFSNELLYDRSKSTIHTGMFILYILAILNILIWFVFLKNLLPFMFPKSYIKAWSEIISFYDTNKSILNILFISGLLTTVYVLARESLTTQSGSKAAHTIDQFDILLDCAIRDGNKCKLVVFVDDLDRVTPEIARNVLDNLRVFFNRSDISFVVAGDHTVLERYIGNQTLPSGNPSEQLEEGRRYLKKIFNVYWRLPLPIKSEFRLALKTLLDENQRETKLKAIFTKKGNYKQFESFLENYFDRNFRSIERFAENVIFTFEVINIQTEDVDEERYLEELKEFPLLVTRILLIQEFCAPLFEKISNNIEILDQLEMAAFKKEKDRYNKVVEKEGADLTVNQKELLAKILFDSDGFYNSSGVFLVQSYQPFISLAADSSFGDIRGPLPEEFVNILNSGDSERIRAALIDGGVDKLTKAAESAVTELNSQTNEITQFVTKVTALINALLSLENDHRSQEIFLTAIHTLNIKPVSLKLTPNEDRIEFYMHFWKWFDYLDKFDSDLLDAFPLIGSNDLSQVKLDKENNIYGTFTSRIIGKWFTNLYISQKPQSLNLIVSHMDYLKTEDFSSEIKPILDMIVDDFISDESDSNRNIRLKIIEKYSDKQQQDKITNHVYLKINSQDETNTTWAISVSNTTKLWSSNRIQSKIVDLISSCSTEEEIRKLLIFSRAKIDTQKPIFWRKILKEKSPLFFEAVPNIYTDENFRPFAPPNDIAVEFFEMIIEKIKNLEEIEGKVNWLDYLIRSRWIWDNIDRMPAGQRLAGMSRSTDERIRQKIIDVKGSWGI